MAMRKFLLDNNVVYRQQTLPVEIINGGNRLFVHRRLRRLLGGDARPRGGWDSSRGGRGRVQGQVAEPRPLAPHGRGGERADGDAG